MASTRCAVTFCENTRYKVKQQNANITFHTFPMDKNICRQWVQFCRQNKNWAPTKQSIICSVHFQPEDYQLSKLPLHEKRIELRRLHSNAVPTIVGPVPKMEYENNAEDESRASEESVHDDDQTNPIVRKYREEFCRACLKYCNDGTAVPIDAQIQNMTLLDMLIQLTAFETEHNDSFPTVMCLQCRIKLEQAFNIRQEFIAQSELLVQMAAEQSIIDYFSQLSADDCEVTEYKTKEDISSEDVYQEHHTGFSDCQSVKEGEIEIMHSADIEYEPYAEDHHSEEMSDLIDHSSYTKVVDQYEETGVGEDGGQESTVDIDVASTNSFKTGIKPDPTVEQGDADPNGAQGDTSWEQFLQIFEKEKAAKRKLKAEMRRALKSKQSKPLKSKARLLEEEAQNSFPFTTCYVCDKHHNTLIERDFHMREHVHMLPFHCNECTVESNESEGIENLERDQPIVLNTMNQLNLHFRMHRMPHKCDKCYRRFSTKTKLKTHLWASHGYGENGLTCEYCGKQYFHRAVFRTHVAHHRNELSGQFKCSICDRSFGVKSSLQRHEASHKGERKYKCVYCDKSFSTSYNRLAHQRTHTGERPFKCDECDRTFTQSTTLKAHQKSCNSTTKPTTTSRKIRGPALLPSKDGRCPYAGCDYTATTYTAMYMHKRTKHMPLYQCEVCSKTFAFANMLKDHMTLHTGEKPHKCETCDRSFRRVEIYRRHLLTHRSDCTYTCEICQKCFKLPQYLQAHMQTHSSVRRFACEICGNSYKTKGELKKHAQRKHYDGTNVEEIVVKAEDSYDEENVSTTVIVGN